LGIEAQGLVEAAHSYSVLNRLTVATEMRLAISSCDRHDIVVNVRGPGLVEPDFLLAIEFAFPEGAEIHKVESHRLLDLVGEITGKNYPGNMGLNEFALGFPAAGIARRTDSALLVSGRQVQRTRSLGDGFIGR
jgi:hypothetical protein